MMPAPVAVPELMPAIACGAIDKFGRYGCWHFSYVAVTFTDVR
jgi:hypothetical protein